MEKVVYISIPVDETTRRNFKAVTALKGERMQVLLRNFVEFYIETATREIAHRIFE